MDFDKAVSLERTVTDLQRLGCISPSTACSMKARSLSRVATSSTRAPKCGPPRTNKAERQAPTLAPLKLPGTKHSDGSTQLGRLAS
jgi:hypothetical protein